MKILHTADWHIGKILHKQSLEQDFQKFSDWLIRYVDQEAVDVVLISGDVFDYANPSYADIKKYYKVLNDLHQNNVSVIVTGGNHDSPALLNGPKNLLQNMNVTVFGSLSENIEEHIIPLTKNGTTEAVLLAVPFLREKDLRKSRSLLEPSEKDEQMLAVKNIYDQLAELAKHRFGKNIPVIAMGHLHLNGSKTSDSERDIHIGNLMGFPSTLFSESIHYVALGHIHKPQTIKGNQIIRYSGSPVFLDFSEKDYEKQVILIQTTDFSLDIVPVKIPVFRKLSKISGTGPEIKSKLEKICLENNELPCFIELEWNISDDGLDDKRLLQEILMTYENHPALKILKSKFISNDLVSRLLEPSQENITIDEMNPLEVFRQLLEDRKIDDEKRTALEKAYVALWENLYE